MNLKRVGVTAAVVICIVAGVLLYLKFRKSDDFEPLIKDKLVDMVSKASNGLYKLSISTIEIDVLAATVKATGVSMVADSARMTQLDSAQSLPDDIFNLTVDSISISGISPLDFIHKDSIGASEVLLNAPNVHIVHRKRHYNHPSADTTSLYDRIGGNNKSYSLQHLLFTNAHITHTNADKSNKETVLEKVNLRMDDILVSATTARDSSRFLFAKDATIWLKNYKTISTDKLYNFTVDSLVVKPGNRSLVATQVAYAPRVSKAEFGKATRRMKERYDVSFNKITAATIDWWTLLAGDGLEAETIEIDGGSVQVYLNRGLPPPTQTKMGKYPHQLVRKMEMPLNIHQLKANNLLVKYEELNPASGQVGTVSFHHCKGTINNITNVPEAIRNNAVMKAHIQTAFMNEASLSADFNFDLAAAASGNFTVKVTMGGMNGQHLNDATEALALVRIAELQVDKLETTVSGNDKGSDATTRFAYHDLKINVLKKDGDGGLTKKGITSFLANSFVVKRDGATPPKPYQTHYDRDPYRSFFNTVWQPISLGITKAIKGK